MFIGNEDQVKIAENFLNQRKHSTELKTRIEKL